jgi:AcrR family transcriptional regulator
MDDFFPRMVPVGHREDLLAGAKRCIYERGYARTTARDIVAASGTNLASIGYHYGSKEALLNAALIEATGDWGTEMGAAIAGVGGLDEPDPYRRFELAWDAVLGTFEGNAQMLSAHFEAVIQAQHAGDVRDFLGTVLDEGRYGLAELFYGLDREREQATAWAVGCFLNAMLTGVMAQWLVDPTQCPRGSDLSLALRAITTQESK